MSNLSAVEATLPPGFRFHPRDEELICDYLMKKVTRACDLHPLMIEVDLNQCEPWDIPETTCAGGKDCYFYSQRDRKYATGLRTNRATASGYWKATGKDRPVFRKGTLVGMRKTLVFYQGRAPKGRKTDWVMHEFRLEGPLGPPKFSSVKEDWVLCRVFSKNRDPEVTKQDMMGSGTGGDTSPSSTSLPYITVDQTHRNGDPSDQPQVPCFSIFTPHDQTHQNSSTTFSYLTHLDTNDFYVNNYNFLPTSFGGGLSTDFGSYLNSSSCDDHRQVIKAVFDQLTCTESNVRDVKGGSSSLGEASTSDSFLSETGLSTMWNRRS